MAKLVLAGEEYVVAPFNLEQLEQAADDIDAVNVALANRDGTWKSMLSSYRPVLRIAEIGLAGSEKPVTADDLMKKATLSDAAAIFTFFTEMLEDSGLKTAGEAKPGTTEANPSSAVPTSSESANLSELKSEA